MAGAVRLLAGRHLLDDPRASVTVVTGVVLAIFVASAFFGFVSFRQVSGTTRVGLLPSSVYVEVNGLAVRSAVEAIRDKPGAAPVAVVREAAVVDPAEHDGGDRHRMDRALRGSPGRRRPARCIVWRCPHPPRVGRAPRELGAAWLCGRCRRRGARRTDDRGVPV